MKPTSCLSLLALAALSSACHNDNSTSPPAAPCTTTTPVALGELQGTVVSLSSGAECASFVADGGKYLIVPQFVTAAANPVPVTYEVGAQIGSAAASRVTEATLLRSMGLRPSLPLKESQLQLDRRMRAAEHRFAQMARAGGGPPRVEAEIRAQVVPDSGSQRIFQVLSNALSSGAATYASDTATLKYVGKNILIYQSNDALPPPNGFTDAQIGAFGHTFDIDLYAIDTATFGPPTDIDDNGHIIVLLTPVINASTPRSVCATSGYIAGFFYALDLLQGQPHSNNGEMFYSLVPDPNGQFSCAHTVSDVGAATPSTFIHEFQHMISFGQHVLIHGGNEEDPWLNEGLSHTAEELGSRYYEHKFPPPTGRTDPNQLFPDSAEPFIAGDLSNSYNYLSNTTATGSDSASVSDWGGDGTLVQRGAVWLFLRWLGDQQDSTVYGRLDQTNLTGVPNLQAASGIDFPTLFQSFSLALYTDSLVGVDRGSVPPTDRYYSRNFRQIYARLNAVAPSTFPSPFPLGLKVLSPPTTTAGTMYPGTEDFFVMQVPSSGDSVKIHFSGPSGAALSSDLGAQVSIFRCPSAPSSACQ
ncbi:MAG TPA: hypothetical protein VEI06_00490 [Gemmatimonadaceae bacterium]|nr:hypothetical protein [Gemmatimonadaceae bacterium]